MTDWADDVAFTVDETSEDRKTDFALALRKAKAAGLRLAADMGEPSHFGAPKSEWSAKLRALADRVERGEEQAMRTSKLVDNIILGNEVLSRLAKIEGRDE